MVKHRKRGFLSIPESGRRPLLGGIDNRVNLTSPAISVETPEEIFYRRYMGGRGLDG